MPNLNVIYQRGNRALTTLTSEITALWGYPARPYEYVTGYRAADNFTGHNADSNGVVHGVDIFVGAGSLTQAQAFILHTFLRGEGLKGTIPGHPDRLYYIIYQDRIAGDFSNWEWVGAGYGHWDHIHVSTCDLFWGDPAPISALDYDSTAPWGLSGVTTQSTGTTPITKDWLDMATKEEVKQAFREVLAENLSSTKAAKTAGTLGWAIMNGRDHAQLANNGARANGQALANVAAQTAAIKALAASKPGLDPAAVQASIDKAVQAALKDLSVTLSVEAD